MKTLPLFFILVAMTLFLIAKVRVNRSFGAPFSDEEEEMVNPFLKEEADCAYHLPDECVAKCNPGDATGCEAAAYGVAQDKN